MTVITGQLSEAKHRCGGSRRGELRDERGALRTDDMLDTRRQDINRGEEVSDLKMSLYVDKGEDRRGASALSSRFGVQM